MVSYTARPSSYPFKPTPTDVGVKRCASPGIGVAFEAQKAIARGDGRNGARQRDGKTVGQMRDMIFTGRHKIGVLAQLGEHLLCKQRVIGSIPIGSTIKLGGMPQNRSGGSILEFDAKRGTRAAGDASVAPHAGLRRRRCATLGLAPSAHASKRSTGPFCRAGADGMWVGSSGG